jgi:FkbM family methyltransferase
MREQVRSADPKEFYPGWKHIPLLAVAVLKSLFFVKPTDRSSGYYRAILLGVGFSLLGRALVHPGRFLPRETWVRYQNRFYLLTAEAAFGYYLHVFEPETARRLLAETGDVFIDLGANTGQYVVPLAGRFKRVIAVEPNPMAVGILRRNLEKNNISNVEIIERAVMARRGTIRLYKGEVLSTWSAFRDHGPYIDVEAITLDELLGPFDTLDLLKIDIEGAEIESLLVTGSLRKVRTLSLAVFPDEVPLIREKLEAEGFEIHELPDKLGAMENLSVRRGAPPRSLPPPSS